MNFLFKKVATPTIILTLIFTFFWNVPFSSASDEPNETIYYILTDHLGSTDVVMDEDGNVVERTDYLPYGSDRLRWQDESAPETDYQYTGKEMDDETGLYYYGARYYDPTLGRFISFDPLLLNEGSKSLASVLQNPQVLNSYSYVSNNPLAMIDENGEYEKDIHYDLTYVLSLTAGLSPKTSKTIAYNDQLMDDNPATAPANYSSISGVMSLVKNYTTGITQNYHFIHREEAEKRLNKAKENASAIEFGQSLHSFQDTYSHGKFYSNNEALQKLAPVKHGINGHAPDKTYLRVELANEMAEASFRQIRDFKQSWDGICTVSQQEYNNETNAIWGKLSGIANSYNSLINKLNTNIHSHASSSRESLNQKNE